MAETLGNASPAQLLMCMAAPIVGAVVLVGFLFFSFSRRNKKQQMKLGLSPKTASSEVNPITSAGGLSLDDTSPPKQSAASAPILDTSVAASPQPRPEASLPEPAVPVELDLNLDLLNQHTEMEAEMMHLSKPSHEPRTGLSARLGHQARPTPEPMPPAASQAIAVPAAPSRPVDSQPAPRPVPPAKSLEPVELLRLLRDPQSGQLIVEIAGRRYTKLAEIADKEIGQYILKLAAQFLAFTNGMIATDAGLKALQAPKVGETPMPLAAPTPVSQLPDPLAAPPVVQPAPAMPTFVSQIPPAPGPTLSTSLRVHPATPEPQPQRRGLFGRPKPAPVEPLLPPLNLAGQINEIAQARLRYSPLAATTQLEITSDPSGGILINVNGVFYHGPDDIPQPEVKELIKASIKEWEQS